MSRGFFKVGRPIFDDPIAERKPFCRIAARLYLESEAEWRRDGKLPRGTVVTTQVALGLKWRWSPKKVRVFLRWLEGRGEIECKTCRGEHGQTIIHVLTYCKDQDPGGSGVYGDERTAGGQLAHSPIEGKVIETAHSEAHSRPNKKTVVEEVKNKKEAPIGGFATSSQTAVSRPAETTKPNPLPPDATPEEIMRRVDARVFQRLREGTAFTDMPALNDGELRRAGVMLVRRVVPPHWNRYNLGALAYACTQSAPPTRPDGQPLDRIALAAGHLRGKTGARRASQNWGDRAAQLLRVLEREVRCDGGGMPTAKDEQSTGLED